MATPIEFVSKRKIDGKRERKRQAQNDILEKAKRKFEKEEQKQKLREERGDDKWMLPAVSESLDPKTKKKKRKKDREKRKHKKSKKHKKSSSESEDSDGKEEWVEAPSATAPSADQPQPTKQDETVQVERDSWMESPFLTATYSQSDIRKEREEKKQEEKDQEKDSINNPGRSVRELNPFWKDGGTGLPDDDPSKMSKTRVGIGDGGTGWLRKSYERVKQQAREEGQSLEVLAAERWGSLEKIHKMLAEVEGGPSRPSGGWRRNNDGRGRTREDNRGQYTRTQVDRDRSTDRDRHRDSEERNDSGFRRPQEQGDDRDRGKSGFKKPSEDASPPRTDRSQEPRQSRNGDERNDRPPGSLKGLFRKPSEEESSSRRGPERSRPAGLGSLKGQFRRPGEDSERQSYRGSGSSSGKWRKPGHERIEERTQTEERKSSDRNESREARSPCEEAGSSGRDERRRDSSSEGQKDGSRKESTSEDSSSSSGEEEMEVEEPKVLTKDEMNQLGAKIVKAEIMGNEDLVKKLKQQLESARKAGEAKPKRETMEAKSSKRVEEEVILSRTNRTGQSFPLPEEAGLEDRPKKRKKKRGVATHDKDGERERYFGNDDNVDLKTMVQREKMGLAEDQNNMFAKAQAKALKSLNDEYTLDDMFVSSANKQSDRDEAQRQRDRAIMEHQKMEAALSRCPYCIDSPEMAKHLIIALGIKVYLCLPRTQSLTSGHCQIVPMQHSTASTALDEDVWNEVQIFRKGLTKMFEDHDKDAVFIEYSSVPKKQRHMVLECIPVPRDSGEMAPIYFKKAIQESETEWSQNKKLIDTRKKDIRHSIPKGFPYFSVDFGLDGGFAHVIEDHQLFPHYFGKEVLGGLLDVEPRLWRNPPKENFESQRKKVMEFGEWWKPFDWTNRIDREKS